MVKEPCEPGSFGLRIIAGAGTPFCKGQYNPLNKLPILTNLCPFPRKFISQ